MNAALSIPASDRVVSLGDNAPPPDFSPFEIVSNSVDAVYGEAKHWLDGQIIESQAEADAIGQLLDMTRKTEKLADNAKTVEKRPHLDANKAIEERFKPLASRLALVSGACKAALGPWELAQEAARQAIAAAARKEADAKAAAAQEALRASQASDIEARAQAEVMLADAKRSESAATKAEDAKSSTKIGGRAVSMRTTYRAEITDPHAYLVGLWKERHPDLLSFLDECAQRQVSAGRRQLPGVTVHVERSAV